MKTKIEIIDETVEYYKTHKRARTVTGACNYRDFDGNKCAVGRCMHEGAFDHPAVRTSEYVVDFNGEIYPKLDQLLKPEYKGHSLEFWRDIQYYHDIENYFNDEYIEELREKYA